MVYDFLAGILKYDTNDKIANNYNNDGDKRKFIATAVETWLGAIYQENDNK